MALTKEIAKHLREVYLGINWTAVNLKDTLADVSWQQATVEIGSLNTIAALVFHINYYITAVLKVLQGEPLNASDKFSFDLPLIASENDWQELVTKAFAEAGVLAAQIEILDERKLSENFEDPKYGNYFRNLVGIIEHTHYHLGQIVLIKKIIIKEKL